MEKLFISCVYPTLMQVVTQFLKLETILDDSIGREIELEIERGGALMPVKLMVNLKYLMLILLLSKSIYYSLG